MEQESQPHSTGVQLYHLSYVLGKSLPISRRGQLTSCSVTTETLCRGHTHQVAVCASAAGETGEQSPREARTLASDHLG